MLGMRVNRTPVLTLSHFCAQQSVDVPPPDCDEEVILERIATQRLMRGAVMS